MEVTTMFKQSVYHRPAMALLLAALFALILAAGPAAAQEALPHLAGQADPAPPTAADNHTPGTATSLSCGAVVSDVIAANGEVDYFKIDNLAADTPIVIKVTSTLGSLDPVLTLYDKDGTTQLATQDDFDNLDPRLHYLTLFNDPQGIGSEHYITVRDYQFEGDASYTYDISWSTIQYVGMKGSGTVGGVAYTPSDILARTRCSSSSFPTWEMFFDGSDVGFDSNLLDFAVMNGSASLPRGAIIISTETKENIPNFGNLVGQDLALFRPTSIGNDTTGTFSRYFDASDVGLSVAAERIDTVAVHPTGGGLMLGTVGKATVPNVTAADEDILLFSPSTLGTTTAGGWSLFFDGSDVGLGTADVQSATFQRPSPSNPNGFLVVSLDKTMTLGGISRPTTTMVPCFNGTFGQNSACSWGQQHAFWRLEDAGLTAIDGHDYGTYAWPGGMAAAAEASEGMQK
jgi:hypothetical protein